MDLTTENAMSESTWIAIEQLVFVFEDGTRRDGYFAIAAPVERASDCGCAVSIEPLDKARMIYGASTLQALVLALRLADHQLRLFVKRGGRVLVPDSDDDFPIDTYFGQRLPIS
jgi:hypothetical protein